MNNVMVDTNVLLDIVTNDPAWVDWSVNTLFSLSKTAQLLISPIIYSELSASFVKIEELENEVQRMKLLWVDLPRSACFIAGKAFRLYRKRGGQRLNVLPDFLIGAHALVLEIPLVTRDQKHFKTYFPELKLISPLTH